MEETIIFYYRGDVERVAKGGFKWHRGYSETAWTGRVLYPWMTKREAMEDAKRRGVKARFVEEEGV
jgi:trehalose utilization protein